MLNYPTDSLLVERSHSSVWWPILVKQPGGLFIEPAFSTFAVFDIDFIPQITVFLHFPESAISLKSTRVLLTGNVKNLSGTLFFSALSVLDNLCSELGQVFVGTVFPSPLPSANMRPNLAIEQGWIPSTLRMKILGQGSFDQPPNNVNCARMDINGEHHICEEVQDELQQRSIIYVKKCKTNYSSVASYM